MTTKKAGSPERGRKKLTLKKETLKDLAAQKKGKRVKGGMWGIYWGPANTKFPECSTNVLGCISYQPKQIC